jgi:hypothetical protein
MIMPEPIQRLDQLSSGFQKSKILFTALQADLFESLRKPTSANEVATKKKWSTRGTVMLLDGLLALDLLKKEDGKYVNSELAASCLVEGAPLDQRHILQHKANGWEPWSQLEDAVRTGTCVCEEGERRDDDLRSFICGMQDIARQSAQAVLDAVDLSGFSNLLDLGGGPAAYSIAFLQAHPKMRGTLFDLPEVIPIGREQVEQAGLLERYSFKPGNMTENDLGGGYDLILLSNIIHSFNPEGNQAIIEKCFGALEDGGMLIVKDFLMEPDRSGPAFGLLFALHMLVHTPQGGTYTRDEVAQWTTQAGFGDGEYLALTPQSRLWMARK